ncbi:MAG: hypothetical protein JRI44_13350 [Deltaproteobacteria bacterium]|nr:hypothetical protein [Deltaproteobacteria bacterium]
MKNKKYITKDSGTRQKFDSGAVRDIQQGKGRFDLLPPIAIKMVADVFERGAIKYGDRNWEKGIPLSRYIDSALRHTFQVLQGLDDEDHASQAAWNLLCFVETRERIRQGRLDKSLNDIPNYKIKEE